MIVQFYGDSLGLPRPGIVQPGERYIYHFTSWLKSASSDEVYLADRCRGGATVDKLFEVFTEDEGYYQGDKEILLIHVGVCDCAPRPIPLRLRNFISKMPAGLRKKIINYLHRNRAKLLKKGFVYYNTDKRKFEELLTKWLETAIASFKRIYIFNIAPTNEDMEQHSPGFQDSIKVYNNIISKVVGTINNEKISLINVNAIISGSEYPFDDLIVKSDGHHLTALAHRIYGQELIKLEEKYRLVHA